MRKLLGCVAVLVALASAVHANPAPAADPAPAPTPAPTPTPAPARVPGFNPAQLRTYATTDHNPTSGLIGLHLDRPSSLRQPHGISLDLDGKPVWDIGIDYEWPDLVLAYSHTLKADNLRMRSDTAQLELGQRVGHPITPFQLHITAGNEQAPLGGIAVATYGYQYGMYLYNRQPGSKRTNISFFNLFAWGTDSTGTGTPDFWLRNYQTGTNPITVSADNQIGLNGSLAHTGPTAGFFGATPTSRPTITGSRSDGTALANLLAKLHAMGLINDNTTP